MEKNNYTHRENTVNNEQAKGKFDPIMGQAKVNWGELTEDDFKRARGSTGTNSTASSRREEFGDTKEAIIQKLDNVHLK